MKIAYFRTSKHDRDETIARLRRAAADAGLEILAETALPGADASLLTVCRRQWAETLIATDPNLLGLLPCSVAVVDKGEETIVGATTPTLLGQAAPSASIVELAEDAEATLRALVESAADVPPPKATEIVLYSTHTCPFCTMEKDWLEDKGVSHTVVYVDDDPDEAAQLVQRTGQRGVPQTRVVYDDGSEEYLIGFDRKALEKIAAEM